MPCDSLTAAVATSCGRSSGNSQTGKIIAVLRMLGLAVLGVIIPVFCFLLMDLLLILIMHCCMALVRNHRLSTALMDRMVGLIAFLLISTFLLMLLPYLINTLFSALTVYISCILMFLISVMIGLLQDHIFGYTFRFLVMERLPVLVFLALSVFLTILGII